MKGVTDNRLEGLLRIIGILENPLVPFRRRGRLYLVEAIDLVIDYQNACVIIGHCGAFGYIWIVRRRASLELHYADLPRLV
ncbi:MAG: hypothetical protein CMD99_10365 [Gammaproteobacteria bacterium]|nr:hypothetical protein [Gammaproteobacteria bacterium]